ncbi:hypothetical protein [Streptomyces sp. NPDC048187]|uniref:hypothetical protein n=1 Tax=Streptomyces sp. NPDC048187 TaxID=3365509 RepID=UPI0037191254
MRATPPVEGRVDLSPRRIAPRHLGAAAVHGVFVAGWYLGQPITPECHVDRAAERYGTEPSPRPAPGRTSVAALPRAPSAYPDVTSVVGDGVTATLTVTACTVPCTDDTSERPRLSAWPRGVPG